MSINILNQETARYIENILNLDIKLKLCTSSKKYLYYDDDILKLWHNNKTLSIDFNNADILNRINPNSKKCNVVKAVEGRSKSKLKILDTTAGLGTDCFTLASRGHKVLAIEKDMYIYTLLQDGLYNARKIDLISNIANNIELINNDSIEYILNTNSYFDCIYIDPMFPPRQKSAKVKQNMQILHEIAFNNEISNTMLLEEIIKLKKAKKAIVKRPINAEYLCKKKPSSQLKGKVNRFDIYIL